MNGLAVLVDIAGFKRNLPSAYPTDLNHRRRFHLGPPLLPVAQETDARMGTAEGCVKDYLKSNTGLDNFKSYCGWVWVGADLKARRELNWPADSLDFKLWRVD